MGPEATPTVPLTLVTMPMLTMPMIGRLLMLLCCGSVTRSPNSMARNREPPVTVRVYPDTAVSID